MVRFAPVFESDLNRAACRRPDYADVLPGHRHRPAPGRDRVVPHLQPGPLGAGPVAARLAHAGQGPVGQSESFYLAFIVGLHCASAVALLWFYRRDWARIIAALLPHPRQAQGRDLGRAAGLADRRGDRPDRPNRSGARTPAAGPLRQAARPRPSSSPSTAASCSPASGCAAAARSGRWPSGKGLEPDGFRRLDTLEYKEAGIIGLGQSLALLAGYQPVGCDHGRRVWFGASTTRTR